MKKNKYSISEEIITATQKCNKDFSCLSSDPLCPVSESIGENLIFIKCVSKQICNYRMRFGKDFICHCPTRKEIHKKYGK